MRPALGLTIGLLCGLGALPASALIPGWKTTRPKAAKRVLPRGKTLESIPSPNRRYVLLFRDEGEKGDFFWRNVYLQQGKRYTLLETCNNLRKVRWNQDSTLVQFEMEAAVGPDRMARSQVEYRPTARTLRQRVTGHVKVEGAG